MTFLFNEPKTAKEQRMKTLSDWDNLEVEDIKLEDLDNLILQYQQVRADHGVVKSEAALLWEQEQKPEGLIVSTLIKAKKSKYYMDEIGTISIKDNYSVATPKTIEDKKLLLEYIKKTYNEEMCFDRLSFNSRSLTSFVKEEYRIALEDGNADFKIPGLSEPSINQTLSVVKR